MARRFSILLGREIEVPDSAPARPAKAGAAKPDAAPPASDPVVVDVEVIDRDKNGTITRVLFIPRPVKV